VNRLPESTPAILRERAELDTLRGIVQRTYQKHERMANSQGFVICLCSDCGAARPFMPPVEAMPPVRFCTHLDENEAVS
jgi:hypothetical protein